VAWLAAPVRFELLLLAVASPVLLLQDGYRYLLWARGQPHRLVVMDGLWLGVFGAAVAAAAVTTGGSDPVSAPAVVGAWVGGGLVSAAAGPLLHRGQVPTAGWPDRPPWPGAAARTALGPRGPAEAPVRPAGRLTAAEGRVVRSLGRSQTILALDANGLPALVAVVAGSTVTGGLRAATVPFLPMVSILGAIRVLTLPVLRRSVVDAHPAQTVGKVLGLYAVVAGAIAAAGLGLVYTVPPAWLGEAGQLARPWYPLAAVVVAARMLSLPLADVLSLGAGPELAVRCRAATTALDWLATAGGAASFGLPGAIAAKAAALLVAIAIWLAATARALARADDGARAGPGEA
jgi:hypothetical protein